MISSIRIFIQVQLSKATQVRHPLYHIIQLVKAQSILQIRHEIGQKVLKRSLAGSQEDLNSFKETLKQRHRQELRQANNDRKQEKKLKKLHALR